MTPSPSHPVLWFYFLTCLFVYGQALCRAAKMVLVAPWVHLTGLSPLGSKGKMSFLIFPTNVSVLILTGPTWVLRLLSSNCGESGQSPTKQTTPKTPHLSLLGTGGSSFEGVRLTESIESQPPWRWLCVI